MNLLYYIIGVVVLVLLWVVFTYNRLVTLRNRAQEAFSDIDVQLKRRANLIPNLVETVKGYASHERGVLQEVTKARTEVMGAGGAGAKAKADNMLEGALKSLFAVAENYPDLKASSNFVELQRELRDAEDKVQAARRFYNSNVMRLNTMVQSFPANLVSGALGFSQEEFFEAPESSRELPQVSF